VNGELQCKLLDFGVWVCIALDSNSKPIKESSRIVNLKKSLLSMHFRNLPESPEKYLLEIEKARFLQKIPRDPINDKNIEDHLREVEKGLKGLFDL
jgi:hypothetical protein